MPDLNDNIQLPSGFKLDTKVDSKSSEISLPKGFTLDTDVKKKDGTAPSTIPAKISSPIESQLPSTSVTDWYKQNMPDVMFVKPISENTQYNKPKEMAENVLYQAAAPIREAKKKADTDVAIKNTAENYFKNNNIDAPEGSPLFNKQVQDLKNKELSQDKFILQIYSFIY